MQRAVVATAISMIALQACLPLPQRSIPRPPRRPPLGTVHPYGPEVYVNNRTISRQQAIYTGGHVATGAASQAVVQLRAGGYVQLADRTDPGFFDYLAEGGCILVRILTGRVYVDAPRVCIEDENIEGLAHSRVHIETNGRRTQLTVLGGRLELRRPEARTLRAGEQVRAAAGRLSPTRRPSSRELDRIHAWTNRRPARPTPPPEYPPTQPPPQQSSGSCCINGAIVPTTATECRKRRGRYYASVQQAREQCHRPAPQQGWCCARRKVFGATQAECSQRRGRFSTDRRRAEQACIPQSPPTPPRGWCCAYGNVIQATQAECTQRRGTFSTDRSRAEQACTIR